MLTEKVTSFTRNLYPTKSFLKTVQRLSHRYMTEALKSTVTPFKPSLSNPSQSQTSKNRCQQMQASSISFKKLPEKSGISQMTDLMISTMLSIQHKEAYHDIKSKRPKPAHPITTNWTPTSWPRQHQSCWRRTLRTARTFRDQQLATLRALLKPELENNFGTIEEEIKVNTVKILRFTSNFERKHRNTFHSYHESYEDVASAIESNINSNSFGISEYPISNAIEEQHFE